MGDLFRQTGSLTPGQKNVGANEFHALVEGLALKVDSISARSLLPGDGQGATVLVWDPLTNTLRRATLPGLLFDGIVTTPRIAPGAVDTSRIAAGAVDASRIAAGAVVPGKFGATALGAADDLDTATTLGYYVWTSADTANRPAAFETGALSVSRVGDEVYQLASGDSASAGFAYRVSADGGSTWGGWQILRAPAAEYESGEETLPDGGGFSNQARTVSHGLGGVPREFWLTLRCIEADGQWSAGEEVRLVGSGTLFASATELTFIQTGNVNLAEFPGNGTRSILPARWRLIFRARK